MIHMFTKWKLQRVTIVFVILVFNFFFLFWHRTETVTNNYEYDDYINYLSAYNISLNSPGAWRHMDENQIANMSKLGRVLFLDEDLPPSQGQRTFKILVWKYGASTNARHMQRFSGHDIDPFLQCSVNNCKVTYADNELETADLVIAHLHRMKNAKELPKVKRAKQIWAFLTDESPYHTFLHRQNLSDYNGLFNWSMHYRFDADIPVPYGRTTRKRYPDPDFRFNVHRWLASKPAKAPIAIVGSNCGSKNHRWEYVRELKKWIPVDIYGACGPLKCPGHFKHDCTVAGDYKFYLAFENSNCDGYLTEKLWWNAFAKNSIPIIMGGLSKSRNAQLLPPHSYIAVDEFAHPRDLAAYVAYLLEHPAELVNFFRWQQYFTIANEHGYFQSPSYHYCRACEALNYNEPKPKIYNDLQSYWSVDTDCAGAWDAE